MSELGKDLKAVAKFLKKATTEEIDGFFRAVSDESGCSVSEFASFLEEAVAPLPSPDKWAAIVGISVDAAIWIQSVRVADIVMVTTGELEEETAE